MAIISSIFTLSHLVSIFIYIFVVANFGVESAPWPSNGNRRWQPQSLRRSTSDSMFCRSNAKVNHAYNIGDDFYIVQGSNSVHRYDAAADALDPKKHHLNELFGQNHFQWVDTVISLAGFCRKSPLCVAAGGESAWRDALENVYIVIGNRRLSRTGDRIYGQAIYTHQPKQQQQQQQSHKSPQTNSLQLINNSTVASAPLVEQLAMIGLPLKAEDTEAALMIDSFWPKNSEKIYYQSGLFFPERGEILLNVYDNRSPTNSQRCIRRKFTAGSSAEWTAVKVSGGSSADFTGMFRLGTRAYALNKENEVGEIVWITDDVIEFKKRGSMQEFVKCFESMTTTTTAATITQSTTGITTKKAEIKMDKKDDKKLSSETPIQDNKDSTMTEKEVLTFDVEPDPEHRNQNKNDKEEADNDNDDDNDGDGENRNRPNVENERNLNGVDGDNNNNNRDGDHDLAFPHSSQADEPQNSDSQSTLAEASARGPFASTDDGLIWTFSILVAVLILLSIIILIPILIIRHNARSDRLYLNKKANKKSTTNSTTMTANSQNSEEVQLMNSSNIEK